MSLILSNSATITPAALAATTATHTVIRHTQPAISGPPDADFRFADNGIVIVSAIIVKSVFPPQRLEKRPFFRPRVGITRRCDYLTSTPQRGLPREMTVSFTRGAGPSITLHEN